MLDKILEEYKREFRFDKFYDNLFYNIHTWQKYHIQNLNFLKGYPFEKREIIFEKQRPTKNNDIRIDLPVWFGSPESNLKIMIMGLEPRDTDTEFGYLNIEHVENFVFATPFALERPKGKYHKAFQPLTESPNIFTYFTDVVKKYHVIKNNDKAKNDNYARKKFSELAKETQDFLTNEINIINPAKIIALGDASYDFLKNTYQERDILRFRHPSWGGSKICKQQMEELINLL